MLVGLIAGVFFLLMTAAVLRADGLLDTWCALDSGDPIR